MFEAFHPFDDNPSEYIPKSVSPILLHAGATCESSPNGAQSSKVVQVEKVEIVIIELKWIMRKEKVRYL